MLVMSPMADSPVNSMRAPVGPRLLLGTGPALGERRHHVVREEPHGRAGEGRRKVADAVAGAEDVVAGELLLRFELADDRVGAADEGQTVVDPEVVGLRAFLKHSPQLPPLRRRSLQRITLGRPKADPPPGAA